MITIKDIAWAAGFLEGEGSFIFKRGLLTHKASAIVDAVQVNMEPLLRLRNIFNLGHIYLHSKNKWSKQATHSWKVYGKDAIQIMMTIYPLMSERRQNSIKYAILEWKKSPLANKDKTQCLHGHGYTKENTYYTKTKRNTPRRICKICHRISNKKYHENKRSKNNAC